MPGSTKPKETTALSSSKLSPIYPPHEANHLQAEEEPLLPKSKSSSRKKKGKKSSPKDESKEERKERKEKRKEMKKEKEKKKEESSSTFSGSSFATDDEEKRRNASSFEKMNRSYPTMLRSGGQPSFEKKKKSSTFSDSIGGWLADEEKRRNPSSFEKILKRQDSCPTMLRSDGQSSFETKKKPRTCSDAIGRWLDAEEKRRNASSVGQILNRQDSCPTMLGLGGQSSSEKKDNSSTAFAALNGTLDDEEKAIHVSLFQKVLNHQDSCPTMLGPGGQPSSEKKNSSTDRLVSESSDKLDDEKNRNKANSLQKKTMNRQESCPSMSISVGQASVGSAGLPSPKKKKKSSTDLLLSESKCTLDDEKKRKNARLFRKILNRQESCPSMFISVGQASVGSAGLPSSKKKKSSTDLLLPEPNGAWDDEKKRENARSFQKISNRQESCPSMLASGGYSCVSPSSAVSRMGSASAVNRREMKSIIESIRRDRDEFTRRDRSSKNLEETLHYGEEQRQSDSNQLEEALRRVDEQRKALLVKWRGISEQRKPSELRKVTS
jgi:hypothetical protein